MGHVIPKKREATSEPSAAGALLDVVALDRSGVLVTGEGALVRFAEVTPRNPRVMGTEEQQRVGDGFAAMVGRLRPGQSLQFYVEAAPVLLHEVLETTRGEVRNALARAPLTRGLDEHHRALRESLVHTDNIISDLESLDLSAQLLAGPEVAELLYRRFNPSSVGTGYLPRLEVIGALDELGDAQTAAAAAQRLREQIAASPVDLDDSRFIRVEQDLERVLYVSSIPDFTEFGWLLQAMEIDRPFALSVHVHALDRRVERRRARNRRRRLHGVNEGVRARRKVPDEEMLAQEEETRELLDELRGRQRSSVYEVAIYQTVRERGPLPDPMRLAEASERAVAALRDAADADAKFGGFMQKDLWLSTLPLGRDVAP